jgi:HJR/Mrr/RecB family endonuclease
MTIQEISQDEFNSLDIERKGYLPERAWFKSTKLDLAGTIIIDPTDKDWAYVLIAKESDGIYRYIDGESSLPSKEIAETKLITLASQLEVTGIINEDLYTDNDLSTPDFSVITSIDDEVKKYFKKNPEKLYSISPRKFEELIASILEDMGFNVELTQATRDGGRDIIAHVRNAVCSYLTHIECKRYAADNKIGVGIIREVIGVHHLRKATKSIIVTTSFFSKDAIKEAATMENQLDLKDFHDIKSWLSKY